MGKRVRYEPGTFSWVDLQTTDPAGAKSFYCNLFGWEAEDTPAGEDRTYTMLRLNGDEVGGLYKLSEEWRERGAPPHWFSYVTVEDADAAAARARELGGTVYAGPFDVLEAGRMAVLGDPDYAAFAVWQPKERLGARRVNDPGCLTWNELHTREPETAARFYSGLFGWEMEPMEEDGKVVYQVIKNRGRSNGGITPMAEQDMPPYWLAYFTVPSCEEAVEKVRKLGGSVLAEPFDIGSSGTIAVARDPQGAIFAVFAGETDD
jgi:predicted enzyme related to lactoylglutathione lyase